MRRWISIFSLGIALGIASVSFAQSGGGGFGPPGGRGGSGASPAPRPEGFGGFGPGSGPPASAAKIHALEAALDRLDARLKDVEAKLAKSKTESRMRPSPRPQASLGPIGPRGFGSSTGPRQFPGPQVSGFGRGPGGPAGPARMGSPSPSQRRPELESFRARADREPFRQSQRPAPSNIKLEDIDRRLDKLSFQLEELSREMRRQRR